jgi:excisionase family DNA binding protein
MPERNDTLPLERNIPMTKHNPRSQFDADWVSPEEAASYLSVSKPTIRKMIKDRRLDGRRLGYRTVRISVASIDRLMERSIPLPIVG